MELNIGEPPPKGCAARAAMSFPRRSWQGPKRQGNDCHSPAVYSPALVSRRVISQLRRKLRRFSENIQCGFIIPCLSGCLPNSAKRRDAENAEQNKTGFLCVSLRPLRLCVSLPTRFATAWVRLSKTVVAGE